MKDLRIITDLQFGSTGKGLFAGYLANRFKPDLIVTAWAPNAGHTFVDASGRKHVNIALPSGIVSNPDVVLLGPGSVIDVDRFLFELQYYRDLGVTSKIYVHEHAAVLMSFHAADESKYGFKIGSTMKGVGEATMHKLRRDTEPRHQNIARECSRLQEFLVNQDQYDALIDNSERVVLEGAQGFSLSLNQGFYPYVTSRECTTHQMLSDCAIPAMDGGYDRTVYGVCRTYPIRVANRYDVDGNMIGTSGPCYDDQYEISWEEIGQEPEFTTVTKLPRRIFTFSGKQIERAVRANGVDSVFLNFCNYMTDKDVNEVRDMISRHAPVDYLGYGPMEKDIAAAVVSDLFKGA